MALFRLQRLFTSNSIRGYASLQSKQITKTVWTDVYSKEMMDLNNNRSEDFQHNERVGSPLSVECLSVNESDNSAPNCRICQISGNSEAEIGELIVSPCDCRGSLGFVHKPCIEKWLRMRNQDTCELCHFKFVTKRRFKSLHEWHLGQVADMLSSDEKGILLLGLVNFILLILQIPFVYYVIKVNARYFLDQINDTYSTYEGSSEIYTLLLVLLMIFTTVLFLSSVTFMVLGCKVFRKILRFSREVVLVIPIRHLEEPLEDDHVV